MPFAVKFRAAMGFPFEGDTVGGFTVESVDVRDRRSGEEGYVYEAKIVVHGPGGKQGVWRALKPIFSSHPTTFSGYGNPYQLWIHRPEIVSLGDKRYEVNVRGAGARIHLAPELVRFLEHLEEKGHLSRLPDPAERGSWSKPIWSSTGAKSAVRSISTGASRLETRRWAHNPAEPGGSTADS